MVAFRHRNGCALNFLFCEGKWISKLDQGIALILYLVSFTCAAIALKYMQAGILYVLWSGLGVIATAALAKVFLGQHIDLAGWVGIGFITIGLMIIAQYSNIDV